MILTAALRKKSGFTLIELLVVMTIIAVLAGLALVSFQGTRKTARDGKRKADLEQIRSALEMRRADCGSYPSGSLSSGNNITGINPAPCTCCAATIYLTIPNDPLSSAGRVYTYNGTANSYTLCAVLETGSSLSCPGSCANCGVGISCTYEVCNP